MRLICPIVSLPALPKVVPVLCECSHHFIFVVVILSSNRGGFRRKFQGAGMQDPAFQGGRKRWDTHRLVG